MRLSDLPPNLRRQAEAKLGAPRTPRDRRQAPAGPSPGRCHDCGEVFDRYGAWERHADASGHHRWALDVSVSGKVVTDAATGG